MGEKAALLGLVLGLEIDPESFLAAPPVETRVIGSQVLYYRAAE